MLDDTFIGLEDDLFVIPTIVISKIDTKYVKTSISCQTTLESPNR